MDLNEIRSYIKAYYPALILVIALVVMAVAIGSGRRLPRTVVQYGTLFLVLVTLATVLQNGQLVKNAAEERELNRDLLIEQQKGAIIQLIVLGIDRLERELSADWDRLEDVSKEEGGKVVLPPLPEDFGPPTKRLVSDVERYYPDVVDDLEEYEEMRGDYAFERAILISELSNGIPEGLNEEIRSHLIDGIIATDSDIDSERRVKSILPTISDSIIRGALGSSSIFGWDKEGTTVSDLIVKNWWDLRAVFLSIQDDSNYSERFATLYERGKRLQKLNRRVSENLNDGRKDFKDEYGILEPEIADAKE